MSSLPKAAEAPKWWQQSVVYQIYPRSFMDSNGDGIGDLPGIISRLDYLQELGVDVLWLSPIYASPNADNGYDISGYQSIMPEFGTMADFDRLLEEAHGRGLKIVLDLVVNHTSDEHPWFVAGRTSRENPYHDYYIWKEGNSDAPPNNWRSNFSGSAWKFNRDTGEYYLHLFHEKQPELNWACPALRQEVYSMMEWWLQKGIDGFRMDVINYIGKDPEFPDGIVGRDGLGDFSPHAVNRPQSHQYLQEMREKVLSRYDILTVGETPFATVEDAVQYAGADGRELNMVFQFEHMELDNAEDGSKWSDKRVPLPQLKQTMAKWQRELHGTAWNSLYWCNHDQPRPVSRMGNDLDPVLWEKSAKMLATCLHMMQGTPYIYQGEELGMTNFPFESIDQFQDVESINAYKDYTQAQGIDAGVMLNWLRRKSRDNARTPMQWNSSPNAGFSSGTPWFTVNPNYTCINAKEQRDNKSSIFHYYRELIDLRKRYPIIAQGSFNLHLPEHPHVFSYTRSYDGQTLWVTCNFTADKQQLDILPGMSESGLKRVCGNYEEAGSVDNDTLLSLQPYEAVVYLAG